MHNRSPRRRLGPQLTSGSGPILPVYITLHDASGLLRNTRKKEEEKKQNVLLKRRLKDEIFFEVERRKKGSTELVLPLYSWTRAAFVLIIYLRITSYHEPL